MKESLARVALVALLLLPVAASGQALAQPPAVNYMLPHAIAPGQTVNVTFYGGTLANSSGIWSNLPIQAVLAAGIEGNNTKADNVVYSITVPADVPVGIGGYRLATVAGISPTRLLMIDDLPSGLDAGNNKTLATAQELTLPIAIDGSAEPESSDFYKFSATAGQRVSVEVVAQRLGTALDPVVRLLDANGKELAYSDDDPGIGVDSRLAFVAPAEGVYIIELRDLRYQGGALHRYRLRVGDFPLATVPFPLGATKGASAHLAFVGPAAAQAAPVDITMPQQTAGEQVNVGAKFPSGQGSGHVRLVASDVAESVEIEPNDAPEQATPIVLPAAINGRFELAKDRDFYQFEAKAGQRLVFTGQTRSLGSPTDLFLRMYNADGGLIAEAEDNGTEEGALNVTFPADGVYRLMAEDLNRRGGPSQAYRIEVAPYQPGFSLVTDMEKYDAPLGGVFVAKVTAVRRDYNGPITLEVQGAGDGFVLADNVIAEGKPETIVKITVPSRIASGTPTVLNIVGRAKIGEVDFTAKASSITPLRAALSGLPYPPEALDGAIGVGVGPVFPDFFKLAVDNNTILFPQKIGSGLAKVKVEKLNNFNDVVTLAVDGLPAGFTAEVQPIAKDAAEVAFAIKGPTDLPEGEHKITIRGDAVLTNQPKTVLLADVSLKVVQPLTVTVVPAGPITINGKQKVKVSVARFSADTGPVPLLFKNLPANVTVPDAIAIPTGAAEVEVELTAANATAGKVENLIVVATAVLQGNAVLGESAPAVLEVTAQ
ncbi:MAG: PPC domain-containing protein [Pirellulales bacterium]